MSSKYLLPLVLRKNIIVAFVMNAAHYEWKERMVSAMATIKRPRTKPLEPKMDRQGESDLKISFMTSFPFSDSLTSQDQKDSTSKKIDFFKLGKEIVDDELKTAMKILARKSN